jgi:hypothetical protein
MRHFSRLGSDLILLYPLPNFILLLMNKKLVVFQILNIASLVSCIVISITQSELPEVFVKFSLLIPGVLLFISTMAIVGLSLTFIRSLESDCVKASSSLSPLFKFLLVNFGIACVLLLFISGLIFDAQILKVCLLFFVIFLYPVITYLKSSFVVYKGDSIKIYNYGSNHIHISSKQVKKIKRLFLSFEYKIEYLDFDGKRQTAVFFPKSLLFSFGEPKSVASLRSICSNLEK